MIANGSYVVDMATENADTLTGDGKRYECLCNVNGILQQGKGERWMRDIAIKGECS